MARPLFNDSRLAWMDGRRIRPYVYVRPQNRVLNPGQAKLDWFPFEPVIKNPQGLADEDFTNQIINLENHVFGAKLAMPRWVFYDCGIMPGFVAGFAVQRQHATQEILNVTKPREDSEWIPLSLFIIIPTMDSKEWVAHNLSSINSALPPNERFYGLGFLSKAFGLWYANIEVCCGMTQWRSPALRLHSHYGDLEIMTAYTPSHTLAQTLTYRLKVDHSEWPRFFHDQPSERFPKMYQPAGFEVERKHDEGLISLQKRLEAGEGPFFLNADEIAAKPLDSSLMLYKPR